MDTRLSAQHCHVASVFRFISLYWPPKTNSNLYNFAIGCFPSEILCSLCRRLAEFALPAEVWVVPPAAELLIIGDKVLLFTFAFVDRISRILIKISWFVGGSCLLSLPLPYLHLSVLVLLHLLLHCDLYAFVIRSESRSS